MDDAFTETNKLMNMAVINLTIKFHAGIKDKTVCKNLVHMCSIANNVMYGHAMIKSIMLP